jgi:hypothetical protein
MGISEAMVPASQVMPEQDWEGSPSEFGFHDDLQASSCLFQVVNCSYAKSIA